MNSGLTEKLKEIFGLFELLEIKGVPYGVSPYRKKIEELITEILSSYDLPREQGFEGIFNEMAQHSSWDEVVCTETIRNLERCQTEYNAGQTNFRSSKVRPKTQLDDGIVYLSYELPCFHADFMNNFSKALHDHGIYYHLLSGTVDIWCRDYMPIPISHERFVQFKYDPSYLKDGFEHLKTDPWLVTASFNVTPLRSDINIDGGNVVKYGRTVIMTKRIFSENPYWNDPEDLKREIIRLLEIDKLVIIPEEPEDTYGHADGIVRFVGEDKVIINDYLEKDGYSQKFITELRNALESNGIKIIGTIPYRSFKPKNKEEDYNAIGCYMNFLEIKHLIVFPKFEIEEDGVAFEQIQRFYPSKQFVQLDCREIAARGGVLNCISWNI